MAMVAKTYNKPLYVAAESYKFARLYPLTQADLETNIDNDSARPLPPPYAPDSTSPPPQPPQQPQQQQAAAAEQLAPTLMQRSRSLSLSSVPASVGTLNPSCDYTPANYISLLFTDMGILTPAAVSDELIKLYQ
jgi:translation initiation factor eIF-2B subunit alpha